MFPLQLSHTFSEVKENHVIIFVDNYQRQTPCKQTHSSCAAVATQLERSLCEQKQAGEQQQQLSNAATMQHTDIQCVHSANV